MKKTRWIILALLSLIIMICISVTAYGEEKGQSAWKLKKSIRLDSLLNISQCAGMALSPDGENIAYVNKKWRSLEIYSIKNETTKEYTMPETFKGPVAGKLAWSPSGKYIAFTENFFVYLNDPDIWVFNVESGEFTDLTDDGGNYNLLKDADQVQLDYLPIWGRDDVLYYFHAEKRQQSDGDTYSCELYRLIIGNQPELLFDLTAEMPGFSVCKSAVVSPDGNYLAIPHIGRNKNDPLNGIWILDLKNGNRAHIAAMKNLSGGLADWMVEDSSINDLSGIAWTEDSKGVVTAFLNRKSFGRWQIFYYTDIKTGKTISLSDFHDIKSSSDFTVENEKSVMRECFLAPDGVTLIYLQHDYQTGKIQAFSLLLASNKNRPEIAGETEYSPWMPGDEEYISHVAKNGVALSYRYMQLFIFSRE